MGKTFALVALLPLLLTGCGPKPVCINGALYFEEANEVYVRDEWGRTCANKSEVKP